MTMKKKERHRLLTRLLYEENIQKQEEFVEILQTRGIEVTQATISRDIKELKLIKVPAVNGGYRYSLPTQDGEEEIKKLEKLLCKAFVSVNQMDKFVYLKTIPGNASAISRLLEAKYSQDLFGLIADDDNILLITKTQTGREKIYKFLLTYENSK